MLPSVEPLVRTVIASRLALIVVAGLALSASAQRAPGYSAYLRADGARADTLRYDVRAGEPLIVALPARVRGDAVRYVVDEAPALSWLVDRSFLWRTRPGERGEVAVRLRRLTEGRADEPVVLLIEVTP